MGRSGSIEKTRVWRGSTVELVVQRAFRPLHFLMQRRARLSICVSRDRGRVQLRFVAAVMPSWRGSKRFDLFSPWPSFPKAAWWDTTRPHVHTITLLYFYFSTRVLVIVFYGSDRALRLDQIVSAPSQKSERSAVFANHNQPDLVELRTSH